MGPMLEFLKELLDDATAQLPHVTPRRAFGSWGYYVDGQIFALAYAREDRLGVKLPDAAAYAEARGLPGASDWAPHGAPMSDWVLLPAVMHDDAEAVQEWVARAFRAVRAMPMGTSGTPTSARKKPARTTSEPRVNAPTTSAATVTKAARPKAAAPKTTAPKASSRKAAAPKTAPTTGLARGAAGERGERSR